MHVNDGKHFHILTALYTFIHCVEMLCLQVFLGYEKFSQLLYLAMINEKIK